MATLADTRPLDLVADFPAIPEGWAYLDTAATAQKPQVVIDAVARALGGDYATVHRGVYARSADMTVAYEAARRTVAAFIADALAALDDEAEHERLLGVALASLEGAAL